MRLTPLFLLALLLMAPAGFAANQAIDQLHAFLARAKSLTADFKQVSFDEHGNPVQTSYGVFMLQRPGRFRWDYQKPFVQHKT